MTEVGTRADGHDVVAAAIDRVRSSVEDGQVSHHNCAAGVRGPDRVPRLRLHEKVKPDLSLHQSRARQIDFRKATFHGLMVVAALVEYRCTKDKFRRQLCGAWAGFHVVSVILDLERG